MHRQFHALRANPRDGGSVHLPVARDGAQEYAFTYADGEVRHCGDVPGALEPSRFFGDGRNVADAERPLLEAVAREFGAGLPRHAITSGRLLTFTTRSWTRPPGDGETYAVIRKQWHRGTAWDRGTARGEGTVRGDAPP